MDLYSGGLIIGRIFASEICGAYFREGLFLGVLIIGIVRYLTMLGNGKRRKTTKSYRYLICSDVFYFSTNKAAVDSGVGLRGLHPLPHPHD